MGKKIWIILISIIILVALVMFFVTQSESKSDKIIIINQEDIKVKAKNLIDNYLTQPGMDISIIDIEEKKTGGIYRINTKFNGQDQPLYITKDGKYIITELINIEELKTARADEKEKAEKAAIVENKTNKPEINLFSMSHCAFTLQFQKGLLPVIEKLSNQINTETKFVSYVLQGEGEIKENLRQYCIIQNQKEKYYDYLTCFLKEGKYQNCLKENNINIAKLNRCFSETKKRYNININKNSFSIHNELNEKFGIKGSPTLVINGEIIQPKGRDPNNILKSICSAFINPPAECLENISDETPTPGFGFPKNDKNV